MFQLLAYLMYFCHAGTPLKLQICLFFLSFLPSFLLVSLRGCLKLPGLTLFTFSLFYRYQEETAWNSAVFRTLDKLHSHSKWIYINKEADTWKRTWKTMRGKWGNKGPAKTSVSKGTEEPYNRSRGQVVMLRAGEREGCKVVNEREFGRVLRLYKVGSEGLAEVLWSTQCDQYSSGFPHYWYRPLCLPYNRPMNLCLCVFVTHSFGFDHVFLDLFSTAERKKYLCAVI